MKLHFLRNGVSAYLTRDVRKKDPSAECALKWCVTYRRKQSYYQTGISLGPEDWQLFCDAEERDFDLRTKKANQLKGVKDDLTEYFEEVLKPLIKELSDNFSFDALNTELFKGSRDSVNDAFDSKIELLTADNSIGNASIYRTTYNALLKFKHYKNIKGKDKKEDFMQLCKQYRHITKGKHAVVVNDRISFDEITPKFLKDCDTFLREIGTSDASIGMYMRTFRALINNQDGAKPYLIGDRYPFGARKGKYAIPEGGRREIALPIHDVWKIENFETDHPALLQARDVFTFMFYANGLNFGDLCRLQYKDINGATSEICFYRKKTKSTGGSKTPIYVPILPPMVEIISRQGNEDRSGYIFPFLNGIEPVAKSEKEIKDAIALALLPINSSLKMIATQLGIDPDISTSYTRNSYITHLVSELYINPIVVKQMVGHSTRSDVTAGYNNLTAKKRREINSQLLNPGKNYKTLMHPHSKTI